MIRTHEVESKIRGEQKKRFGTMKSALPIGNSVVDTGHPGLKIGRRDPHRASKVRRGSTNGGQAIGIQIDEEGARYEEIVGAVLSKKVRKTKRRGRHDGGAGRNEEEERGFM